MRPLYTAGGIIATGLAAVGAFLPIMPTVPFLLVAVFCFARSNPAWEQKILITRIGGHRFSIGESGAQLIAGPKIWQLAQ